MQKFRLSLALGDLGYLHFTEDNEQTLRERLESLISFREEIISKYGKNANNIGSATEKIMEYPTIVRPSNQNDAIVKVLDTDWGRRMPRTENELHLALANNAIHMEKKTLCARLTILTRSGKVARIRRNGVYAYTLPLGRRSQTD